MTKLIIGSCLVAALLIWVASITVEPPAVIDQRLVTTTPAIAECPILASRPELELTLASMQVGDQIRVPCKIR